MEQKLLALKVLLESQSNNNSIGIDVDELREEVDALRKKSAAGEVASDPAMQIKKQPTGEIDFDPAQLAGSPSKKKKQSKRTASGQGENSVGSNKIIKALSK